jgi:YidC/Oxa1 family membrane protein insertase
MAILAGALQFVFAKLSAVKNTTGQNKEMAALNTQMLYFFPILIIIITWNQPAGLALYWVATTLFSIGEQLYIKRING